MNGKSLRGIDGVLGDLLSPPPRNVDGANETSQQTEPPFPSAPVSRRVTVSDSSCLRGARRGRPLGRQRGVRCPREKVTLRISSTLASEYRDWSWEARCSLSALVEKALVEYSRRR